jgi:hypothetical protein
MSLSENVVSKPHAVKNRLSELGLTETLLIEATKRGMAARFTCTANHPPLAAGFYTWSETVRGLRDVLAPLGWGKDDAGLLPLAVSPDQEMAIAVATGDEYTGNPDVSPCTKSSKGPRTKDLVESNALQLHLFETQAILKIEEEILEAPKRVTYWLLIRVDERAGVLHAELSTPVLMGGDRKISGWDERIILGEVPFDSEMISVLADQRAESEAGVVDDIQIKRRV